MISKFEVYCAKRLAMGKCAQLPFHNIVYTKEVGSIVKVICNYLKFSKEDTEPIVIAFIKYSNATSFHSYLARIAAVFQAVFILSFLFFSPVYGLFYFMIVLGLLETLEEITLIFIYDTWVSDVKGYFFALNDKRRINGNDAVKQKTKACDPILFS